MWSNTCAGLSIEEVLCGGVPQGMRRLHREGILWFSEKMKAGSRDPAFEIWDIVGTGDPPVQDGHDVYTFVGTILGLSLQMNVPREHEGGLPKPRLLTSFDWVLLVRSPEKIQGWIA